MFQLNLMRNDEKVFHLYKYTEAHSQNAQTYRSTNYLTRIGNTIVKDILLDTGAQVNTIPLRVMLYAAQTDYIWSNAMITGVWDHDWAIGGFSGFITQPVLGTIVLPVFDNEGKQKLITLGVYPDDLGRIVLGRTAMKELGFTLTQLRGKKYNLLESPTFDSRLTDELRENRLKERLSVRSSNRPPYEALVNGLHLQSNDKALIYEYGEYCLTAPVYNHTGTQMNPRYKKAMQQRAHAMNDRYRHHKDLIRVREAGMRAGFVAVSMCIRPIAMNQFFRHVKNKPERKKAQDHE